MANNYAQLRLGGKNDKSMVIQLQKLLNQYMNAGLETDGIFGPKTDKAVRAYQKSKGLQVDGIVGPKTWSALLQSGQGGQTPAQPLPSEAIKKEMDDLAAQAPGEFAYGDQALLDAAWEAYQNQTPFAYDPNNDPLYRQQRDQMMTQGRQAMEDAVGLMQTQTGGYGNSYAQTAGQQAYQGYLQELSALMPQLYELAYNKHTKESDRLRENYQMHEDKKERERQDHEEKQKRHDQQMDELYDKYIDQRSREDKMFERLVNLVRMGYVPTSEEMAAVGLTPDMVAALLNNPK